MTPQDDRDRYMDDMQRRMTGRRNERPLVTTGGNMIATDGTQTIANAPARESDACPSPGCPQTLTTDASAQLLRCSEHGPMRHADESP